MCREAEHSWPNRVAAAIAAELKAAQPEEVGSRLIPALRRGRAVAGADPSASQPPPVTEEIVAAGVASMIARRKATGAGDSLAQLHTDLVEFALTPYLGPRAAADAAREAVVN